MSLRGVLTIVLLGIASGIFGYALYQQLPGDTRLPQAIGLRPDFNLPDIEGRPRSVTEWNGKVLVLNFWATWCPPCRREIPMFVEMQEQYGDRGLQFVGVAIDNVKDVSDFAAHMAINYPLLVAEQEAIGLARQLGNSMDVLPFTAIIDRQGRIVFNRAGELRRKEADQVVLPLL